MRLGELTLRALARSLAEPAWNALFWASRCRPAASAAEREDRERGVVATHPFTKSTRAILPSRIV